jgi:hypothetical protein
MRMPKRLMIIGVIAALFLSIVGFTSTSAQSILSEEQLQKISNNCVSIKNTLNQLHASDALLRVNRGQVYEAMATKLMDRFNSRLTSNDLDAVGTTAVTNSYRTALNTFRTDYQSYERQLSATIKIDCTQKPSEFHAAIENAREKREVVHKDVIRLHQYIDDYRSAVNDFFINFERVTGDE